ncbi:MAG: type I-C CRISPR-associated protein Cas5c [Spirochaetes bacterium]|nr:type I-C CRISPR-associated protein Cas5c [Spirochaetota bacterium]
MSHGITLHAWGRYACFTRPEMKVERVSYDVMTPSAARGILEAIYWKPAIRWRIERIHVLAPIRFTNIRRNELAGTIPLRNVQKAMRDLSSPVETFIEDDRQQRAAMVLEDVDYVIEASFDITEKAGMPDTEGTVDSKDREPGKHHEIFMRRAQAGQCFNQPYFGTREFPVSFASLNKSEIKSSPLKGERDLGWMLHDIDFENGMEPRFFHAVMRNGVIEVPLFESREVRR